MDTHKKLNKMLPKQIDMVEMLRAVQRLLDVEDQIEGCTECYSDSWCINHAIEFMKANSELRRIMGREQQNKKTKLAGP